MVEKDGSDKLELLKLLDNASNSSLTRQTGEIMTYELPYGGMFSRILVIAFISGLFVAFLFSVLKDFIDRNKSHTAALRGL
jgi:capsular polysaccharide biosynthesis protein